MGERAAEGSDWDEQYRSEIVAYQTCAAKLESLIEDLLADAGIDVVAVESRAKDADSLRRKVEGKKDKYKHPLADVTDLIGVRVIAYYLEDVEQISQIVDREFVVDPDNSVDKLDDLGPDRFGYRSVHHVVSLSSERARLAEWGPFGGKRAEIQVRTATQHAWAAVEHKLSYKRTREAPHDLRRRLTRLSALFELADEQFSGVRKQLGEVEAQYSDDVKGGNLDLPIDKASLDAFMAENETVRRLIEQARQAGFELMPPDATGYKDLLDVDLRDLVFALDRLGIETIAEFDVVLRDTSAMSEVVEALGESLAEEMLWRSPPDVLTTLILYRLDGSDDLVESIYEAEMAKELRQIREARKP